jgi:hypothetical protein
MMLRFLTIAEELRATQAALLRAHCDLRAIFSISGMNSIALAENADRGFDPAWEKRIIADLRARLLDLKPSFLTPLLEDLLKK